MTALLSILERRPAGQRTVAIKQHDLGGDAAALDDAFSGILRRARHGVAKRYAFGPRQRKSFGSIVRFNDMRTQFARSRLRPRQSSPAVRGRPRRAWSEGR